MSVSETHKKVLEELSKTGKTLMISEPFYGLFLIMLNKKVENRLSTAGVRIAGINFELSINPEFWSSLSEKHRLGLLKHELMHIALHHLTEFTHLTDKELANIAMDIEIHNYITEEFRPEGGLTIDSFPELALEPRKGTLYYYEKLRQAAQNNSSPALNELLDAMKKKKETSGSLRCPDHSLWEESEGGQPISEAKKKLLEAQTKHILNELAEQVAKSRGTIPGEIQTILDKINFEEPPKFDWKGFLRRFTTGSIKTFTKLSRKKLNRRIESLPGLKIKRKKHILVAIDTSASVSNSELIEFMQEIHHIHKTGAEITMVHADTAISYIGKFDPKAEWKIHGRGGTDFNPVVDYYNENVNLYTCLIYLTDGEAPPPENNIKGRHLWVLSERSGMNESLPKPIIKLHTK